MGIFSRGFPLAVGLAPIAGLIACGNNSQATSLSAATDTTSALLYQEVASWPAATKKDVFTQIRGMTFAAVYELLNETPESRPFAVDGITIAPQADAGSARTAFLDLGRKFATVGTFEAALGIDLMQISAATYEKGMKAMLKGFAPETLALGNCFSAGATAPCGPLVPVFNRKCNPQHAAYQAAYGADLLNIAAAVRAIKNNTDRTLTHISLPVFGTSRLWAATRGDITDFSAARTDDIVLTTPMENELPGSLSYIKDCYASADASS